jgi:hypothetical protein
MRTANEICMRSDEEEDKEEELKDEDIGLLSSVYEDSEAKRILFHFSDTTHPVKREYNNLFFLTYQGNSKAIDWFGRIINFFVSVTGEDSHCELVFGSKYDLPLRGQTDNYEREHKNTKKTYTKQKRKKNSSSTLTTPNGNDPQNTLSNGDANTVVIPKRRKKRRKRENFYTAFRITSSLGVACFQDLKELDDNWSYAAALHVDPDTIQRILLWCISQRGKPFDGKYIFSSCASILAQYRLNSQMIRGIFTPELDSYVCTTLVVCALTIAYPELNDLFNESGSGIQGKKVWCLTPTKLKELLLEMGKFNPNISMHFRPIVL